jgi:hypothetical protein
MKRKQPSRISGTGLADWRSHLNERRVFHKIIHRNLSRDVKSALTGVE